MRTKKIVLEPFEAPLYIATSPRAWEMLGQDPEEIVGCVMHHRGKMYILLPAEYEEFVVWHEAHHAARIINDHYGVITTPEDHEADVYMQEAIVRAVKRYYGVA